jgi:hypothetical protein
MDNIIGKFCYSSNYQTINDLESMYTRYNMAHSEYRHIFDVISIYVTRSAYDSRTRDIERYLFFFSLLLVSIANTKKKRKLIRNECVGLMTENENQIITQEHFLFLLSTISDIHQQEHDSIVKLTSDQ